MTLDELRKNYREQILALAAQHSLSNVRVFGSVARGNASTESDVDFLVTALPNASLMKLGGFYRSVSEMLGVKIDVVTDGAKVRANQQFEKRISDEAVPL